MKFQQSVKFEGESIKLFYLNTKEKDSYQLISSDTSWTRRFDLCRSFAFSASCSAVRKGNWSCILVTPVLNKSSRRLSRTCLNVSNQYSLLFFSNINYATEECYWCVGQMRYLFSIFLGPFYDFITTKVTFESLTLMNSGYSKKWWQQHGGREEF